MGITCEAGLPNITGQVRGGKEFRVTETTGCFESTNPGGSGMAPEGSYNDHGFTIDASLSSPIYGNSDIVMPASVNVSIIIYLGR